MEIEEVILFETSLFYTNLEMMKRRSLGYIVHVASVGSGLFAYLWSTCFDEVGSVDIGEEITYNQGNLERECNMVTMLGCKEDKLRAILGQVGRNFSSMP